MAGGRLEHVMNEHNRHDGTEPRAWHGSDTRCLPDPPQARTGRRLETERNR